MQDVSVHGEGSFISPNPITHLALLTQNLRYMQATLCPHEAGTVAMATRLKNSVTDEVERFAQLALPLLRLTSLDG